MENISISRFNTICLSLKEPLSKSSAVRPRQMDKANNNNNEKCNSMLSSNFLSNYYFVNDRLHIINQNNDFQFVPKLFHSSIDFNFGNIQTRLKVSQPGDVYEQEADRVAEQIMRTSALQEAFASIHIINEEKTNRKCQSCQDEEKEKKIIHRKMFHEGDYKILEDVEQSVGTTHVGGSPLDGAIRSFMESRFGFDFSDVRVHTDERAAKSANKMNALAYTVGQDIYFGAGQYSATREEGKKLLAHELVHVIQQDNNYNVQRKHSLSLSGYNAKGIAFADNIPVDERQFITHKTTLAIQRQTVLEQPAGGCGICYGPRGAGNVAHRLIQEEFEIIFPLGLTEFPFSSPTDENGRLDLAVATPEGIEIGEIKPANAQGYVQGAADISFYYAALHAIYPNSSIKPLTLVLPPEVTEFPNYQVPNCPLQMIYVNPPVDGIYGYYCRPSYDQLVGNPNCRCGGRQLPEPIPVPIPVPLPIRVPETERERRPIVGPRPVPVPATRSIREEITDFIQRVVRSGENAEEAARRFLQEHPEVKYVLIGAAIGIVLGTILEDIATLGAGIADDPASFAAAYALIRMARTGA
jgi:Domain of unknown function (DUF4157)